MNLPMTKRDLTWICHGENFLHLIWILKYTYDTYIYIKNKHKNTNLNRDIYTKHIYTSTFSLTKKTIQWSWFTNSNLLQQRSTLNVWGRGTSSHLPRWTSQSVAPPYSAAPVLENQRRIRALGWIKHGWADQNNLEISTGNILQIGLFLQHMGNK